MTTMRIGPINRRLSVIVLIAAMLLSLISGLIPATPTAEAAASEWQANAPYQINDWVSYNGLEYQSIQAHTSQEGMEPSNAPTYWSLNGKSIPGKIEAEYWDSMNNVQNEATTDTGAGMDVGNIKKGSWMDYKVNIANAGKYQVEFRLATKYDGETLELLGGSDGASLVTINVPNTGNWQKWATVTAEVNLPAGPQTLRIATNTGNFNINWMNFVYMPPVTEPEPEPNPTAFAVPGKINGVSWTAMNGVSTEPSADPGAGTVVNYIDDNDWMDYEVNVATTGYYNVSFRVASKNDGGKVQLKNSAGEVLTAADVPNTGNWSWWTTVSTAVKLNAGEQTLRVYAFKGGFNFNWFEFTPMSFTPTNVTATAGDAMATIHWQEVVGATSYQVKRGLVAGGPYESIGSVSINSFTDTGLMNGSSYYYVVSALTEIGESGNSTEVNAKPTGTHSIPGKMNAVQWLAMNGVQSEASTDPGIGTHVAWIDTGDWMDYSVKVSAAGGYSVDFRVASKNGGGKIELRDDNGTVLGSIDIPSTGSYTSWTTVNATVRINADLKTLRVYATSGGFNLNWIEFATKSYMPTGLFAFASDKQAQIGWAPVAEATTYHIKRSLATGGPYERVNDVTAASYVDSNLSNGTAYYYVVSAETPDGESPDSAEVYVMPRPAALLALQAVPSDTQVHLQWAAVQGADRYEVKRSMDGGATYQSVINGWLKTSYTDAGLTNHDSYQYVVIAKSGDAPIGNSSPVTASPTAPIASPTGLAALPGNAKVTLTWNAVEGATSYTIKRSTVSGAAYTVLADGITLLSYSDTTVVNGTAYYYVVSALNASTGSMNTEQVIAVPTAIVSGAPAAPGNVQVTTESNRVVIAWGEVEGAESYNVRRSSSPSGPFHTIATVSTGTYTDTGVTNGMTYYYVVAAVKSGNEGNISPIKAATPAKVIIVSQDGTGDFKTIKEALNSIPNGNATRQVIYIRNGLYHEKIAIPSNKPFVSFIGESRDGTILTYGDSQANQVGTSESYTVLVSASDFSAESLTIQNEAFPRTAAGQAVALYVNADRAIFNNVRLSGYQDTLYVNSGRQYYVNSIIEGDVDWIFGNANAFFDHSEIKMVGNGGGYVTAASTDEQSTYGLTFLNSKLTRGTSFLKNTVNWDTAWDTDNNLEATNGSTDLGRPWRGYANVKFINTWMDSHIRATAWSNWGNAANEQTARYGEYNSSGPGANAAGRLKWASQLTVDEANLYTAHNVLRGTDNWDPTVFGDLPRNGQPPAAPTGLTASNPNGAAASLGETSVQLSWNEVAGVHSYNLYRSKSSGSGYTLVKSGVVPTPNPVLSHIEAENWLAMSGVEAEATTDVGGGQDVGHVSANDWMDYTIQVPEDGAYTIDLRVATRYDGKQLQLRKSDGTVLTTVDVPNTGNWQNWTTISAFVNLKAGSQMLRLFGLTGDTNVNWFELIQGLKGKVQYSDTIINAGESAYYVVTAVGGNGESGYSEEAGISNTVPIFDRNVDKQANISISIFVPGRTVTGIVNGTYTLVPNVDYTVNGSVYTINKSYLMKLALGVNTLSFQLDPALTLPLTIQSVNTSSLPSQTIASVPNLKLYTVEGIKPYLPTIVPVLFTDGSEKALPVTWDAVDSSDYASVGSFTLHGVITGRGASVIATMTVESTDSVVAVTGGEDVSAYLENLPFDMPDITLPVFPDVDFNIQDYGAVGDGTTMNTDAFGAAIAAATNAGGGRVIVPAGTWLTGPIELKNNVNLHLEEGSTILFNSNFSEYLLPKGTKHLLSGKGIHNAAITGNGVIDGNGQNWRMVKKSKVTTTQWNYLLSLGGVLTDEGSVWYPSEEAVLIARPILVDISDSDNVLVDGPTLVNGPVYLGSFTRVRNLIIRNTTANNDAWFQNGDGLDVTSSQNVVMYHNTVTAGDDSIGMKSSNSPSPTDTLNNVVVADNIVFRGHGGLSMGSNTAGGIHNMVIRNNQYIGTDGGLNIKSYVGNGGPIDNIYFDGIHMTNIGGTAINISDFYQGHDPAKDLAQLGIDNKVPEVKNLHINKVTVDGASTAVSIEMLQNVPLHDVVFNDVKITSDKGWVSSNTKNISLNHVQITAGNGTLYTLINADGFTFNDVLVPPRTGTFLYLSGTANQIQVQDTDFSHAGIPFYMDAGISPSAITITNPGTIEVPSAPSNVDAKAGNTQVLVTWDTVTGADHYVVKRRASDSDAYMTLAEHVMDTFYLDANAAPGTYSYIVIAGNTAGESGNSDEAEAAVETLSTGLPIASMQGPSTVRVGESFGTIYGINRADVSEAQTSNIYKQVVNVVYDPSLVHYQTAEALIPGLELTSVEKDDTAGRITILLSSPSGIAPSESMLRLTWKAIGLDHAGDVGSYVSAAASVTVGSNVESESKLRPLFLGFVIKVDKSKLAVKIDQVSVLNSADYSPQSWAIVQTYLNAANAVNSNSKATQNQVDAALSNLTAAMNLLNGASDTEALASQVAEAQAKSEAAVIGMKWKQYSQVAVNQLNQAIAVARSALNDPNANQQSLNQAIVDLEGAMMQFDHSANAPTIGDLSIMSAHYGLTSEHGDWSEFQMYDLNQDSQLNVSDLTAMAQLILQAS